MDIYPIFFLLVFFLGSVAALLKDPLWGLVTYVYVYYNIPSSQWWGAQLPDLRWSLISAVVLILSCLLHRDKLSTLPWSKNRPGKWLLVLLILMLVVVPFTPDPSRSWMKIYDFSRYVIIYYLVSKVLADFRRYKIFLGVLLFCTFYLTILAHHYFDGRRLDGVGLPDAGSANMLAGLMVLVIPLYLVLGVTERGWVRWTAFGAIPFVLNTFVMCGSRGAFVGIMIQGSVAILLLHKYVGMKKILACCVIVAVGLLFLMSDQYRDRLLDLKQGIEKDQVAESSAGRWEIWQYGLEMAKDYPFGVGGGGFMALSTKYMPIHLIEHRVGTRASHNTYLLVLVEQGAVGLLIFFGFIWAQFSFLRNARQKIRLFALSNDARKLVFHTYAVQISLAGFWGTAFFADRLYFEAIYLVVGLIPGLFFLANQVSQPEEIS